MAKYSGNSSLLTCFACLASLAITAIGCIAMLGLGLNLRMRFLIDQIPGAKEERLKLISASASELSISEKLLRQMQLPLDKSKAELFRIAVPLLANELAKITQQDRNNLPPGQETYNSETQPSHVSLDSLTSVTAAVLEIGNLGFDLYMGLDNVIPQSEQKRGQILAALDRIASIQAELLASRSKISAELKHSEAAKKALERPIRDFGLLSEDMSTIFGLPNEAVNSNETGTTIKIYQNGVLAGLPRLTGLDDDLPDLPALKTALEAAGAKPARTLPENLVELEAGLQNLRSACQEASQDFSNHEQALRHSTLKLSEADYNLRQQLSLVRVELLDLLHLVI